MSSIFDEVDINIEEPKQEKEHSIFEDVDIGTGEAESEPSIFDDVDIGTTEPKQESSIFDEIDIGLSNNEQEQEPNIFEDVNIGLTDEENNTPKEEVKKKIPMEDEFNIFDDIDIDFEEEPQEELNEEELSEVDLGELGIDMDDLYVGTSLIIESESSSRMTVYQNAIHSVPANCNLPMQESDILEVIQPSKKVDDGDEELVLQKIEELRDVDRYSAPPSLTVGVSVLTYKNFKDSLDGHKDRLVGGRAEEDTKKFVEEEASTLPPYLRNHESINTINSMLQDKKTTKEIVESLEISKRIQNEFQRMETERYINLKRDILNRMNNRQASAEKDADAYLNSLADIFVQNEVFMNDFVEEVQTVLNDKELSEAEKCKILAEKLFYVRAVIPSEGAFICGKCGKLAHNKMPFFEYIQDDTSTSGSTRQGNIMKETARFCIFPPNKCEHCGAQNILSGKEIAILNVKSKTYDLAKRERVIKLPTYAKYIPSYDNMYDDLGDVYFRTLSDYVAFEKTLNPGFRSEVVRDDLQLTGDVEKTKEPSIVDRYNIKDMNELWNKGIRDYKRALKIFEQQKTKVHVQDHSKEVFYSNKPMNEILPKISEGFTVNAKILCGIFGRDYNKMKTNAYHSLILVLDDNGFTDVISRRPMGVTEAYKTCKVYFSGELNCADVQYVVNYLCEQFNIDKINITDPNTGHYLPNFKELVKPLEEILDGFNEVEDRKVFNKLISELNENFYLYTYTKITNARCDKADIYLSCRELRDWLNVTTDAMISNALAEDFANYYIPVEASSYTPGSIGIGIKKTGDILKPQVDKKFALVINKATSLDDNRRQDNILRFYTDYLKLNGAGDKSVLYAGLDIHCLEVINQLLKAVSQGDIIKVYRIMMKLPNILNCEIINAPLLSKLRACLMELKPLCDELYARYDNLADYQIQFNIEEEFTDDEMEVFTVTCDQKGYILKRHEGEPIREYTARYARTLRDKGDVPIEEREDIDRYNVLGAIAEHKIVLLGASLIYSMCVSGIRGEITKYLLYRDALYMGNIAGQTIDDIVGISKQISATYLSRKTVNILDEIEPAKESDIISKYFILNFPSIFDGIEEIRNEEDDGVGSSEDGILSAEEKALEALKAKEGMDEDSYKISRIIIDPFFSQYLEILPANVAKMIRDSFGIAEDNSDLAKALQLLSEYEKISPFRKEIPRDILREFSLLVRNKELTETEKAKRVIERKLLDSLYGYLSR